MMSVNRVTEVLDNIPDHRKDSQFLRELFSEKEVQLAIDINATVAEHWCNQPPINPTSSNAFIDADEVLYLRWFNYCC